ncbi:MAG: hypothetical protein LC722_04975, partial [Actinobacteria bacterium]|nr:hypothetical protein [Actinomycetota bacterium]
MSGRGAVRTALGVAAGAALVMVALMPAVSVHAQDAAPVTLGSFTVGASAGAVFQTYHQPSAPIPAKPTQEFSISHSEATVENGSSYGLSSIFWPGPTAANAPGAIHDLDPRFPLLPNYPVRAETFFPASEGQETEAAFDAGIFAMRSKSTGTT